MLKRNHHKPLVMRVFYCEDPTQDENFPIIIEQKIGAPIKGTAKEVLLKDPDVEVVSYRDESGEYYDTAHSDGRSLTGIRTLRIKDPDKVSSTLHALADRGAKLLPVPREIFHDVDDRSLYIDGYVLSYPLAEERQGYGR